ncbi:MAG: hypothetical protein RIS94_2449, partial [Pseudomonadota bacterium]
MKVQTLAALLAATGLAGCAGQKVASVPAPVVAPAAAPSPAPASAIPVAKSAFAKPSALDFALPDFPALTAADYQAGIEEGIAIARGEVAAIAGNPDAPTFANTIEALEKSGQVLDRASRAFSTRHGADTSDALDAVETATAPQLAAWDSAFYQNAALFGRVEALYDARATLPLSPEQARVLELYHQDFVLHGAQLSDSDKAKVAQIDQRLATLETAFGQKVTNATRDGAVVVHDKAQLAGLSPQQVAAAAEAAKARGLAGQWVLSLQNTTVQPLADDLSSRAMREAVFKAGWTRATRGDANDTRKDLAEMAALRAQKAGIMGFANFAALKLSAEMAGTPDRAIAFMDSVAGPAAKGVARDARDINAAIRARGERFSAAPWDWKRYAEDVRAKRYAFDAGQVKPYFEVWRVLEDGVFYAAGQLYGLSFHRREDLKGWRPEMRAYEVREEDGRVLGLFLIDPFQRDSKQGGAWMDTLVPGSPLF